MNLYLASTSLACEHELVRAAMPYLPQEKFQRIERCRVKQQRMGMALSEVLLAWALRKTYGITPRATDRFEGNHGKPLLRCVCDEVSFNISHSGSLVLVGVDRAPLGVDIQEHRAVDQRIARKIMDPATFAAWMTSQDQASLFCDCWARRESELKWWGVGISGLGRDDLALPKGVLSRRVRVPEGYSAWVCATLPEGCSETLAVQTVPLEELCVAAAQAEANDGEI